MKHQQTNTLLLYIRFKRVWKATLNYRCVYLIRLNFHARTLVQFRIQLDSIFPLLHTLYSDSILKKKKKKPWSNCCSMLTDGIHNTDNIIIWILVRIGKLKRISNSLCMYVWEYNFLHSQFGSIKNVLNVYEMKQKDITKTDNRTQYIYRNK